MPTIPIPLTQGQTTIVDEADYELVRPYCWWAQRYRTQYYAVTKIRQPDGRRALVGMHRVILAPPPGVWVDHRNRDPLDNRRENLRFATPGQNNANSQLPSNNTSGFRGVTWVKDHRTWRAQVSRNGRTHCLGHFDDPKEAARAYDDAARALFGPFARCNFPQ